MLDRALMDAGYRQLCENWRRKPSDAQCESWYQTLVHKLHDDQFRDAIEGVIESERGFPALATLLDYGRSSSRHRKERGVPHVRGGMRLRDLFEAIEEHRDVPVPEGWWTKTEEWTFLNAVEHMREEYELPKTGEQALAFLELVAMRAGEKLGTVLPRMEKADAELAGDRPPADEEAPELVPHAEAAGAYDDEAQAREEPWGEGDGGSADRESEDAEGLAESSEAYREEGW